MAAPLARDQIVDAVRQLPPEATLEDAIERLLFLAKVERGLADADAGRLIPHEEAKRRLLG
jgi:predicted transcriptional regulator